MLAPPAAPDASTIVPLPAAFDLRLTMAPLAHGTGDPTIRIERQAVWRGTRTRRGPATVLLQEGADGLAVSAWGPGAHDALAGAPELAGLHDDPAALIARHPVLGELQRRYPGVRLPRSGAPFEALLPAICEQKITGAEARRVYRSILRRYGEPAPGPGGLWLAPDPSVLADVPYFAFHPLGLERRRAEVIRRAARTSVELADRSPDEMVAALARLAGIGPWTVAEVRRVALGDPDAVSVGDYHVPSMVAYALAGERRADDARMLELLKPYAGQRGRVQRLLEVGAVFPARRGPRLAPRRIEAL
ncbi:MAG TPA: DNA-3-methyladenine glycosylase 2 family protein [Candidatus Limnocylindria bacterium]|nr:DNA-3-methyladenine glycosylase 2 family protein [Candidatus Limnocylindria bacterium]